MTWYKFAHMLRHVYIVMHISTQQGYFLHVEYQQRLPAYYKCSHDGYQEHSILYLETDNKIDDVTGLRPSWHKLYNYKINISTSIWSICVM